jgi:hypothetical protein
LREGEDPPRSVRSAWRGQYCRTVPPRGDRPKPLLPLVEGISGSRQKRLVGDTARAASSDEVKELRWEASAAEEVVAPASPGATTLAISSPSPVSRGGLGLFASSER